MHIISVGKSFTYQLTNPTTSFSVHKTGGVVLGLAFGKVLPVSQIHPQASF